MKRISFAASLVMLALAGISAPAGGADSSGVAAGPATVAPASTTASESAYLTLKVPLFSQLFSAVPVATVNDEPIAMDELVSALQLLHEEASGEKTTAGKNEVAVLNRLITTRLISLEAENMGFGDLPELKDTVEEFASRTLRERLKKQQIKDIKPDQAEVEKNYRELVKEWKIKSVRFDKEDDAKELARAVQGGGDFNKLANELIDKGKVQGEKDAAFMKPKDLLPQIAAQVATMQVGTVSPVIPIGPAFTVMKLEDVRYPEKDADALETAQQQALDKKKVEVLSAYKIKLIKKYVKERTKVLSKLDFEAAKPGFKKLLTDKRVVADIKGGKPITVAELAAAVSKKFFHGIDQAIKEKKVNELKLTALDDIVYKRAYSAEAYAQGIDKTDAYKGAVKEYRTSLLFGTFLDKVVAPDIKVSDDDMKTYFNEHIPDYSSPEMIRLLSLAFTKRDYAEKAVENLRKGSEFAWLKVNAEGQADASSQGLLQFDGSPLITKILPEKVRRAVAGIKTGDARVFESDEGFSYLLLAKDVIPPKPSAFESERKGVAKKVFNAKMNKALEEWAVKLKDAYRVRVYLVEQAK